MKKTPCYGYCPVYTIQIDSNGNGRFQGVENTELIGLYAFRITTKEIKQLKSLFEQAGFFSLKNRYHEYVTDLPTVYLTYRREGMEKKIMDYYGAPQELKDLEKQVESLVLSKKMKKIK